MCRIGGGKVSEDGMSISYFVGSIKGKKYIIKTELVADDEWTMIMLRNFYSVSKNKNYVYAEDEQNDENTKKIMDELLIDEIVDTFEQGVNYLRSSGYFGILYSNVDSYDELSFDELLKEIES